MSDLSDNESNRKRVLDQQAFRRKNQRKAEREAEDQQTIDAGKGPRKAKQKANEKAVWLGDRRGTSRKRPQSRSPSPGPKKNRKTTHHPKAVKLASRTPTSGEIMETKGAIATTNRRRKIIPSASQVHADELSTESDDLSFEEKTRSENSDETSSSEADDDEMFSDRGLSRQLENEIPHIGGANPGNLFDDDENVEFASARAPDRSSSPMEYAPISSLPKNGKATKKKKTSGSQQRNKQDTKSDSDDNDIEESESDTHSDTSLPRSILPNRLIKKLKKHSTKPTNRGISKRDQALVSERTSIVTSKPGDRPTSQKNQKPPKPCSTPSKPLRTDSADSQSETGNLNGDNHNDTAVDSDDSESGLQDEHEWHRVARLVGPQGTGLLKQNRHITALAHECIEIVIRNIHVVDPWKEHHNWAAYRLEVLLQAVDSLIKKSKSYEKLRTRILLDPSFCSRIGKWFMNRIAGCRYAMIASARHEICGYRLGKGEKCIERVHLLVEDDAYCHPGSFISSDAGGHKKMAYVSDSTPSRDLKFLHPVIIDTLIGAYFSTPTASGWKYRDSYKTSLPDRPEHQEPEIPMSMVALAATAVYTAIWEMREGAIPKPVKHAKKSSGRGHGVVTQDQFSGNTVLGVYKGHLNHLMQLKEHGKVTYHKLMAKIYNEISSNDLAMQGGRPGGKFTCAPLAGVDRSFLEN